MSREVMPNLYSKLIAAGTSFSDYVVTTPLCCPSRAAYLTGQYGHNNGVLRNFYPDLRNKRSVLPTWLQRSGYKTAHVGKFLNKYELEDSPRTVAPGWDLWMTQLEKRKYYDWKASKNGKLVRFGTDDRDHVTTVTSKYATRWASRLAAKEKPFYLQVDYFAPHTGPGRDDTCKSAPKPEPEDVGRFGDVPLPQPPSFNQEDVSEMPVVHPRPPEADRRGDRQDHRALPLRDRVAVRGRPRRSARSTTRSATPASCGGPSSSSPPTTATSTASTGSPKGKPFPYEENIHMPLT